MKKPIILAAAFAVVTFNLLAQNDSAINGAVSKRFDETFPGASNVAWTSLDNKISKAHFRYDGQVWLAFFDANANLVTSGRKVRHSESLPLQICSSIEEKKSRMEKKYGDLAIAHTFEMMSGGITKYYSTLGNDNVVLVISTSPGGSSVVESKKFKPERDEIRPTPTNVIAKKGR